MWNCCIKGYNFLASFFSLCELFSDLDSWILWILPKSLIQGTTFDRCHLLFHIKPCSLFSLYGSQISESALTKVAAKALLCLLRDQTTVILCLVNSCSGFRKTNKQKETYKQEPLVPEISQFDVISDSVVLAHTLTASTYNFTEPSVHSLWDQIEKLFKGYKGHVASALPSCVWSASLFGVSQEWDKKPVSLLSCLLTECFFFTLL